MLTPAAAPTPRRSVLAAQEVENRALIDVTKQLTHLRSAELQRPGGVSMGRQHLPVERATECLEEAFSAAVSSGH